MIITFIFLITTFMIMIIIETSEDKDQVKGPKIGDSLIKYFGYYIAICFSFFFLIRESMSLRGYTLA